MPFWLLYLEITALRESVRVRFGVLRFETKDNSLNKNTVNFYFVDQGKQER